MAGVNLSVDSGWDIWQAALKAYPWKNQLIMLQTRHDFPVVNQMFKKDRMNVQSGTAISWQIAAKRHNASAFVNSYQPNTFAVNDLILTATVPWVMQTNNYSISIEELQMNAEPSRLVNLADVRREACLLRFCEDIEDYSFSTLADSSDVNHPYGIPYLFPKLTTAQKAASTVGFVAQNPVYTDTSTASTWCGIDRSVTANALMKSYADSWTNSTGDITDADAILLGKLFRSLKFKAPANAKQINDGMFDNFVCYTNGTIVDKLADKARKNNDTLDPIGGARADVVRFQNQTYVHGFPVAWNDKLDDDTLNPFYAINHDYVFPVVADGDFFRESTPKPSPELHRVIRSIVDLRYNFAVKDPRRAGGVVSYVA